MEENKNNTQKQPEQKKKKKSDVLLTIALIVAIAVFCYAAFNLYHIYTEYKKGTDEYNQIEEMAVTERGCCGMDLCRCTSGYQLSDRQR